MIEGALIAVVCLVIGYVLGYHDRPKPESTEKPYDKYKNKDGLYTRRAVKGGG